MSKISNALIMLQLLSSGRKYSVFELASILEVSERMIRSYKEDFEKAGIYINTIMGPHGGYVLSQRTQIANRNFIKEEFKLLDKYIAVEESDVVKNKLLLLRDKIKESCVWSFSEEEKLKLEGETLIKYNLLSRAIKNKQEIKLLYHSYSLGDVERVIRPFELILYDDKWFCSAYCNLRHGMRHFEFSRMLKYEIVIKNNK